MEKIGLVYIVDDDEIVQYMAEKMIMRTEIANSTLSFRNGEHALECLRKSIETGIQIPDAILLDLSMPIMDGWEFLEEYRKLGLSRDIPLYIISSSIDYEDRERIHRYEDHVHGFISKPLTKHSLASALSLVA